MGGPSLHRVEDYRNKIESKWANLAVPSAADAVGAGHEARVFHRGGISDVEPKRKIDKLVVVECATSGGLRRSCRQAGAATDCGCSAASAIGRLHPTQEPRARHAPGECKLVLVRNFGRMPSAGGPVLDGLIEPGEVDGPARQR